MSEDIQAKGRFLFRHREKFAVCGVTFGPFAPEGYGIEYQNEDRVRRDFEQMVAANVNAVRTYTLPPCWFLDIAEQYGLKVMVGLAWEQHVAFLDQSDLPRTILQRLAESVRTCARHPAV